MVGDDRTFSFSTSEIPERERLPVWREVIARKVMRLDLEPLEDAPFSCQMSARTLTGLELIFASTSPLRSYRSRSMLADGDDSLCLLQASNAVGFFTGLGREITVGPREAIVIPRGEVTSYSVLSESKALAMHVPRAALAPMLRDQGGEPVHVIPAQSGALQLLGHFVSGFENGPAMSPELQRVSVSYVYDLLALALGPTRDAAEVADRGGLRAARLRAVKSDILANLHSPRLTITAVAKRHRVSPRYIQMLFESEGMSFSQFVRDERLAVAHRMLSSPHCELPIGAIAYETGFSDLSNFNHAFRGAYGMTPSDVRAGQSREMK